MSELTFEARGLTKTYRRWWSTKSVKALDGVDLAVEKGTIFGLLGPNGAGKTTLIKLALTIAHADSGEVRLLGQSVENRQVLGRVGFLPENPRFPAHLTARHALRLYGSLSGVSERVIRKNSADWLERVGLTRWADTRVSKFSKGMNERLGLAQALVHDPDLIFLDEPTDGLDPVGRREVRSICRELADQGKTIFINSHILAEIEMVCDRIALMKGGRIVDSGSVREITAGAGEYEVTVLFSRAADVFLRQRELCCTQTGGRLHVSLPDRSSANALIDTLRANGIEIDALRPKQRTLESVMIEKMEEPS